MTRKVLKSHQQATRLLLQCLALLLTMAHNGTLVVNNQQRNTSWQSATALFIHKQSHFCNSILSFQNSLSYSHLLETTLPVVVSGSSSPFSPGLGLSGSVILMPSFHEFEFQHSPRAPKTGSTLKEIIAPLQTKSPTLSVFQDSSALPPPLRLQPYSLTTPSLPLNSSHLFL